MAQSCSFTVLSYRPVPELEKSKSIREKKSKRKTLKKERKSKEKKEKEKKCSFSSMPLVCLR